MSSDGAERTVMTLWRRDCPTVRSRSWRPAATGKDRLPTVESLKGVLRDGWCQRCGESVDQIHRVSKSSTLRLAP